MLDIAEHRQKLILKNLAQLDDRINEIQEECIILYQYCVKLIFNRL